MSYGDELLVIPKVAGSNGLVNELRCIKVPSSAILWAYMSGLFSIVEHLLRQLAVNSMAMCTRAALAIMAWNCVCLCQDVINKGDDGEDAFVFETRSRQAGTNGDCRTEQELANPKLMELIRMVQMQHGSFAAMLTCLTQA